MPFKPQLKNLDYYEKGEGISIVRINKTIADWILDGSYYHIDITHGLGVDYPILVINSNTAFVSIEKINNNTLRLLVPSGTPECRFDFDCSLC